MPGEVAPHSSLIFSPSGDAACIITYKNRMHKSKGSGLVKDIFTDKKIDIDNLI